MAIIADPEKHVKHFFKHGSNRIKEFCCHCMREYAYSLMQWQQNSFTHFSYFGRQSVLTYFSMCYNNGRYTKIFRCSTRLAKVVAKSIASCTICWYNLSRWRKTPHPLAIRNANTTCVWQSQKDTLRFFRYPEYVRLVIGFGINGLGIKR